MKDLRIVDRTGAVMTQGAMNALMDQMDVKDETIATLKRQVEAHRDLLVRVHDFLIAVVNARISQCPEKIYTPQIRCSTADDLCAAVQEVIEGRKQKGGAG